MADEIDPIAADIAREQQSAGSTPVTAAPAPATTPPADDDAKLAQQIAGEQRQADEQQGKLLQWRAANNQVDPARQADVLRYSAASDLAPDFVQENLDEVKKRVDAQKVNWNAVAYRQPALTKMLLEQPQLTPLVKDDAAQLGGIEWALTAPFHALRDAIGEQVTVGRQFGEAIGLGSEENRQRIGELEGQFANKDYGAENFLSKGVIGTARMLPYLAGDVLSRAAGGGLGLVLGGGGGAAAGAEGGPAAVGTGIVGGVGGAAVGQFVGSGLFNYFEALGPLHARLSALRDSNGAPLDPGVVDAFAQSGAMLQAGLMAGFLGKYTSKLPGVKQLLEKASGDALEKSAVDLTLAQTLKKGTLSFGQHWATGAAMVASQSALNTAAADSAEAVSGQPFDVQWNNIGTSWAEGFKSGIQDMWLISALGPGREMLKSVGRARASAESAARLETMTSSAAESKLLERSPEEFEKAIARMKGTKDAVENVYVPAEEWTRYWQEQKVDPAEKAAEVLGDGGKGYTEALSTKGDVVIPVEKYLAKLAKTEHAVGLHEDAKLRVDELTPRQFKAEQKSLDERLKDQGKVRGAELEQGKTEVREFIRDQAVAAGIGKTEAEANAKLVSEYAGTMALRLGVSVQEAAATGSLGQLRILGSRGEAVAIAARDRFQRFLTPEASRLLDSRLASMSPENRAREVFVDSNTGLINEKAFKELPADDKPLVGHISVEGVKYLNDSVSHDKADALYRTVAKALHEVDPQAAKVGGDFAVRVKDAAELEQLVAKVNQALPVKGFSVTGAVGKDFATAGAAHGEAKAAAEKAGTRAPRASKPLGLQSEPGALEFPDARARAELPPALANRIASLSDSEYFKEAYVEKKTGLLTAEGWNGIPRKAFVASIDLKGLKAINDKLGNEMGDRVLRAFGRTAAHFGGSSFDFAHLHGDEYAAQHSDSAQLEGFLATLKKKAQDVGVDVVLPDTGEEVLAKLIDFRQGIGRGTYEAADRELNAAKSREKAGAPSDQFGGRASGKSGDGADLQGPGDLESWGPGALGRATRREDGPQGSAGLGRGAAPQARPGEVVAHVEGVPVTFEQPPDGGAGGGAPRGVISLQLEPGGRPRSFDIQVFSGDKSTLLHETSHFLSWSFHDLATSDLATPEVRHDYEGLLHWAGYDSVDERLASTKERAELSGKTEKTRQDEARLRALSAKEEKISHGWEQYLLEGKAPSEGLARVFSRFKGWLTGIYKGLGGLQRQFSGRYGQELGLSDDARRIFDRMLAQDDALTQAAADTGSTPPPLVTAAMTPAERIEYRKALAGAHVAAEQALQQRTAELERGQLDEGRARISQEVATELDKQPLYRAQRYLQRGEVVDSEGKQLEEVPESMLDKDGKPYKLNRKDFVEKYGPDVARLMPAGVFGPTKKSGVEAEQLAPLLGFVSGDEMVQAFSQAEPRDRAIAKKTQARMDAEYGPVLQKMADAAMAAVHNDERARATLLELRALAKAVDPATEARINSIRLSTLKSSAEQIAGESTVGALDPARYARAERQSALKAAELTGAKKKAEALEQREARLFNQLLYRAARDASEQLERIHDKLANTSESIRGNLGKADPAYRDVHDQVLEAVGINDKVKAPGRQSLDQLLQRVEQDAQTIDFDVDAIRELIASPKEWESLTVDQAHTVGEAITNIRHLARQTLNVELAGKKQTRDAWFKEFAEVVGKREPLPLEPFSKTARTAGDKLKALGRGADAMLTDVPETYAHMLDGGQRDGPIHRLLVDGRLEAREKSAKLGKEVLEKIVQKWEDVPKDIRKLRDERVDVAKLLPVPPGGEKRFSPIYTRDTLWSLFLNWGNEGNRQRVRDGMGWTNENVTKALQLLTKPELKFLQGVLDGIQSLYPELAASHERRTGLPLGKVEATPISLNDETYAGGYFPLKYRSDLSRVGEVQEGQAVKDLFAPNYVRPAVSRGHTKARAKEVTAAVDLSWGVVPAHLGQVIHDISYGDWVREAGSIMIDPRFKELAALHLGPERAKEFIPWLRDVANDKADSASGAAAGFLEQAGSFARNRAAIAVMGANIPAILPQVLDPWNSIQENVPARHVASAYVKVNAFLAGAIDLPELKLSKEISYRDTALKTNLRTKLAEMGPTGKGVGRAVSETAFALYELSDKYTTRVTWKAAYDDALSRGLTVEEAANRGDDVVRRAFASHDVAEKPPIMRSKRGLAALVMFYSFSNRMFNSGRRSVDTIGRALGDEQSSFGDKTKAVANFGAKLMFMGLTGAAVAYIAGRGPKKEDDATKWLAWRVALEPFSTVPFVGGMLDRVVKGQKANARSSPELALLQTAIDTIGTLAQAGENEKAAAAAEALIGSASALFGLPAGQLARTGGYVRQLATGEARPRNAADVASGLLYGKRKDQPVNPLSQLGDFIQ